MTVRSRSFVVAAFWLGLGISILCWWLDTVRVTSTADWLMGAGRITGIAGGYLLLTELVLMSRALDRYLDATKIAGWHRDLGGSMIVVLLAHATLITAGYAAEDGSGFFGQSWTLLTEYEDMITAYLALAILLSISILALRKIRAKMRYELFYYLHLSAYATIILGYAHQFTTGAQFAHSGLARTWWTALYGLTIGFLCYGRIVKPGVLFLRHRPRVASIVPEAPGVVSIYVTGRDLSKLDVQAGQFFRWRFLTRGGWWQAHPFSLSAAPDGRSLRLTVKSIGDHSRAIAGLKPGVRIWLEGPSGGFTAAARRRDRSVLIAGGIGIAPIRALLEDLPSGSTVLYRARAAGEVLFHRELTALSHSRGHELHYLLGSRSDSQVSRFLTPEGLQKLIPDVRHREVYLCGPAGLTQTVLKSLTALRVPRRRIHLDPFEL